MKSFATMLALLLATTNFASAETLDEQVAAFINAPGFDALDTSRFEQRLDQMWLDTNNVSPGGKVGPIEKAMMIADTEIASTRTRSAVAYGEIIGEDGTPYSLIEVRHYNLGPTIHTQTEADYGAENTADAAEFGLGEHKAWRFVFLPMMNNAAILMEVSSRTIPPKEAAKADCTGRPCLDAASGFDSLMDWTEMDGTPPNWLGLYPPKYEGVALPAYAIAQLGVIGYWANAESGDYYWSGGEHPEAARDATPYRFIGIDRNLGQETSIDAVWHETLLNDDSIETIAFRYIDVAGQVYLMQAAEPWQR